ncbi:hypothetical protein B9Z55_001014 [Caenorhabditis nigoni]|uniref:SXP/RAL-2 family protein Ani s 5-like cation-binding domain-containing protein n=1 Tax=Caenorhabditis nigoni TaxID=1611254 RepID=A0A2G5VDS7_9PELO|nr:hypothetical protein B9Z55_001014 [Caenorhabditis nigoni]
MLLRYVFLVFCLAKLVINGPITEVSVINQDIESTVRTNLEYLTGPEPESDGQLDPEDVYEEGRIDRLELGWWKKMKHSIEKTLKNLRDEIVKDLANKIVG